MNRTEYMRQLESLLQNISATEREEALQYYNEYFNDAGPENEQNVIEALGNPAKVAENIKKDILWNGYGENSYQRAGADSRSVITYPADPQTENGNGEQRNRQSDASQTAQAQVVSPQKNEGMSTGMIVLIVILCILASPVILGAASAGIGVAAGLIAAWFGLIIGFGATAAALILVLIALVAAGIISMFTHPFVGMCLIGAGLICGGIGLLFLMLTVAWWESPHRRSVVGSEDYSRKEVKQKHEKIYEGLCHHSVDIYIIGTDPGSERKPGEWLNAFFAGGDPVSGYPGKNLRRKGR